MCLGLAACLVSPALARAAPAELPPPYRAAWLALLHYPGGEAGRISDVRDPSFFLHEEGWRDPGGEWEADRRAFLLPAGQTARDQHAQCRFPARFALMKAALGWTEADVAGAACPELDAFRRRLAAGSVAVVFASHYLANPSSAFGHTMLHLGAVSRDGIDLADYSVSFEADTEGMSAAGYIPRGLMHGLKARFRVAPLHERVRKYERQERRDLWLFPLRITQPEREQIFRHLWELREISFRYGFFGGNCAQKILALVHAVAPRYRLLPVGGAAILPAEAVRRLVDKIGLAGPPLYRPSLSSMVDQQLAALRPTERELLRAMIASRTVPRTASPMVLSAALLWSELDAPARAFRRASEATAHRDAVWRRALWNARVARETPAGAVGALGPRGAPDTALGALRPAVGPSLLNSHSPSRFTLRGGVQDGAAVLGAGVRWLLHDPVDPFAGYPAYSSLEVGRVDVELSGGGLILKEATALRLEKLAPASRLDSALAWRIDVSGRRLPRRGGSPLHIGAEAALGMGAATSRSSHALAVYALLGARPGAAVSREEVSFSPVGVGSCGLLVRAPADIRAHVAAEAAVPFTSPGMGDAALTATARKRLARDWDLELSASLSPDTRAAALGVIWFR